MADLLYGMDVSAAPTGGGIQVFEDVNFGGTPKLAIFELTSCIADDTIAFHNRFCHGAADGINEACTFLLDEDGVNTTNAIRWGTITKCIAIPTTSAAGPDGEASWVSFTNNKVTINWTNAPSAAVLVKCTMLGGTDFNGAVSIATLSATINTPTTVTPGFPADIVILQYGDNDLDRVSDTYARYSSGWGANDGGNTQRALNFDSRDNASSASEIRSIHSTAYGAYSLGGNEAIEIGNFTATTYDLTTRLSGIGEKCIAISMSLGGGNFKVGTYITPITAIAKEEITSFETGLVMVNLSTHFTMNVEEYGNTAAEFGTCTITENDSCSLNGSSEDNVGLSNTFNYIKNNSFVIKNEDEATKYQGVPSLTATGWQVNFSIADPTPRYCTYIAFEKGDGSGPTPITFTPDFKTAALADIRCPRARVQVYWGNALQDKNVVITSNDFNRVNRTGQVRNEAEAAGEKWAFLGNELVADGAFHPMPISDSGPQVGWFGSTLCNSSGDFVSAVWLQVAHDARAYATIKVVGDNEYYEYPVDFDITFTHPTGPTVINVVGNTERVWEDTFAIITGVTAVKIEVTKWSAIDTIVKITQFAGTFIEVYDGSDIVSLNILEETNTDTGAVPIGSVTANELDLVLANTDRRFSYGNTDSNYVDVLISGRKILVWLGFVLPAGSADVTGDVPGYIVLTENGDKVGYMPYGVYWSKDWISSHDTQHTRTIAHDMVSRLRQLDFLRSDNYTDTVGNIVDTILSDAQTFIPDLTWMVSADISSISWTDVYFEAKSFLEILKDISEATLAYTFVDRTGNLIVGSKLEAVTPVLPEQQITLSEYFNFRSQPKIDELINSIRVGYSKYTLEISEDIYTDQTQFEIPAGETELKLYIAWEKIPVLASSVVISFVVVSSTGTMLFETAEYAAGADITATGTAGDIFTLSAVGQPYTVEEITETVVSDSTSISRYGQREFALTGNILITSAEKAQEIAAELLSSYGDLRQDGEINWPCSTLVAVGDTVEVTEFESLTVTTTDFFIIKRQMITFTGALDSEMEIRRG